MGYVLPFRTWQTTTVQVNTYITYSYLLRSCKYRLCYCVAGQKTDPKELKRQRERERYALNRDAILKKRQEARDRKRAAAAILNEINTPSKLPGAMSPGYSIFSIFIIHWWISSKSYQLSVLLGMFWHGGEAHCAVCSHPATTHTSCGRSCVLLHPTVIPAFVCQQLTLFIQLWCRHTCWCGNEWSDSTSWSMFTNNTRYCRL